MWLIFLSGCVGTATGIPVSTDLENPEKTPQFVQTEIQTTVEPIEGEVIQYTPTSTPEILYGIKPNDIQLQSHGLLSEFVGDLDTQEDLTFYEIEVNVGLDPSHVQAWLEGTVNITYTNQSRFPLNELVLMLWPNNEQYNAEMDAGSIRVGDRLVDFQSESDDVVLRIPLETELQPNESIEVNLPFKIESNGSIRDQRRRFGITNGVFIAPTFYPLIPRLVNGEWQVEVPPEGGDTTNSDMAYYHVTIKAPKLFEIVASGVEVDRKYPDNDLQQVSYVTGPMRDFAMAVGSMEKISRVVNDVKLNVWILPNHAEGGEQLAEAASRQMGFLHDLVGPYPYPELDIVDTPCAFGGIEYPSLIYICSLDDDYFIDTTIHEVAHQWFYGLIGNDQIQEPWLDESAATYWQVLYYENAVGEDRAASQLVQYRQWASDPSNRYAPIGLGIGEYPSSGDYYTIVYFKGALFYDALRDQMGDEDFFDFLRIYYERYRYQFIHSIDFQKTAEEVCECDLNSFFDLWVYQGGDIPGW